MRGGKREGTEKTRSQLQMSGEYGQMHSMASMAHSGQTWRAPIWNSGNGSINLWQVLPWTQFGLKEKRRWGWMRNSPRQIITPGSSLQGRGGRQNSPVFLGGQNGICQDVEGWGSKPIGWCRERKGGEEIGHGFTAKGSRITGQDLREGGGESCNG